jgi:hypothetical protein
MVANSFPDGGGDIAAGLGEVPRVLTSSATAKLK